VPSDPSAPEPELEPGTRLLDRYVILDRVGSGGMASIWRASDERLDRVVCVKLLRLVLEGGESGGGAPVYQATYTHFLQEALALSKLQHPNTLRIYDFGYLDDGRPYQISEFLDGGNLETQIRTNGRFEDDATLGVLEKICGAVSEAHDHGIIHRDIKPSNILFARVGRTILPKLADFGIASSHLHRTGEHQALSSVALFSPRWAAPEQLSGAEEGPATDVYALGLVTAYMLSGKVPFADPDLGAHYEERIRGDVFADSRLAALGLPDPVRAFLMRAMTFDPKARTASAPAFFDDARAALARMTTVPPPPIPRRPFESISLIVETENAGAEPSQIAPPERMEVVGARPVRVVEVDEMLDFTIPLREPDEYGPPPVVRFRATLVPSPREGFALHLKGLNCFIAPVAGGTRARPTPAITAAGTDGEAELVSGDHEVLGAIHWSFGRPGDSVGPDAGRAFDVGGGVLVVPYREAAQAIAIDLGAEREVIVMGRRR
jgi:serine/threonine-protein kinase